LKLVALPLRQVAASLAKLSPVQRAGTFVAFLALLVTLVLHNPIDGYTFMYEPGYGQEGFERFALYNEVSDRDRTCDSLFRDVGKVLDSAQPVDKAKYEEYENARKHMHRLGCTGKQLYPFSKWHSDEPLMGWFGSVAHLLWAIALILVALTAWLLTFRPAKASTGNHAP
jgi:hypothetical protein